MISIADGDLSNATEVNIAGSTSGSGQRLFEVIDIVADTTSFGLAEVIVQYASGSSNNQKMQLDAEL